MTNEEKELLYQIIERILENSVKSNWPHQTCDYCSGSSAGYYDSREFRHINYCPNVFV